MREELWICQYCDQPFPEKPLKHGSFYTVKDKGTKYHICTGIVVKGG